MKTALHKTLVLTSGIFIMLAVGCEEQNTSNPKRDRLVAVEGARLKNDLELRDKKIEEQKELLEECEQEKKALSVYSKVDFKERLDGVIADLSKENTRLQGENKEFKARIEQLEKELRQLKEPNAPSPMPSTP
jgi:predicted RNase H-like nuclease (RuvC/YqgF family)